MNQTAKNIGAMLEQVRANVPLIHNITNYVTVNDVANAVLAIGASPIMADDIGEAGDISAISSALVINMGYAQRAHDCVDDCGGQTRKRMRRAGRVRPGGCGRERAAQRHGAENCQRGRARRPAREFVRDIVYRRSGRGDKGRGLCGGGREKRRGRRCEVGCEQSRLHSCHHRRN